MIKVLTVKEVQEVTTLCRQSIYNLIKQGEFPEPKRMGRRVVWTEKSIEDWLNGGIVYKPAKEIVKTVVKRFTKPDPLELVNYFLEKGSSKEEAEIFFNYYESNGWKVGKNVMKNWKAAASGWIKRNEKSGQGATKPNKHEDARAKNRAALEAAQRAVLKS